MKLARIASNRIKEGKKLTNLRIEQNQNIKLNRTVAVFVENKTRDRKLLEKSVRTVNW